MADESYEISISVSGEGQGQRAFENLSLAQLEAKQKAQELATELRRLKDSGEATDEQIEETARAMIRAKQAAAQYATEARRVQQAQQRQEQAAQATTAAQNQVATSALTVVTRIGAVANSLGQLGSFLGQTTPELASLGQHLGQVASAAGAGGAAFGPWGAAIGGAIGAVTSLIGYLEQEEEAHRAAAAAIRQQTTDLDLLQERLGNQERIQRLVDGLGTVEEQTRALEAAESRLAAEHERLRIAQNSLSEATARRDELEGLLSGTMGANTEATRRLQREYRTVQATIRGLTSDVRGFTSSLQTQQQVTIDLSSGLFSAENREREMREADLAEREAEQRRARARQRRQVEQNEQEDRDRENVLRAKEAANQIVLYEQESAARIQQVRAELAEWTRNLDRSLLEQRKANIEAYAAKEQEVADRLKTKARDQQAFELESARQHNELVGNAVETGLAPVTDAAGEMFRFLASGAEGGGDAFVAMLDAFLEATAIEYTIRALGEAALAVGAAARYDYAAAAQHGVAAAMAGAVAAATGIAGAAIQSPTVPAGGGGPATLQQGAGTGTGGGSTMNVTLQLFAPQAVFTEAERGQIFANGVREARRQLGPSSVRF